MKRLIREQKTFLGTGWSFPPVFDKKMKQIHMVSDEEDIKQSLHLLLSTSPGERIMQPNYGCDLFAQAFKTITATNLAIIRDLIATAILNFEPRINLESIDFDTVDSQSGYLGIQLTYTIRKINIRTNIVFPFYYIEGTNIAKEDM
ncbi:MAG: phage baseplate assembly protein W [Maribacter sp.]|jgi:phage baseplate assembly protein W